MNNIQKLFNLILVVSSSLIMGNMNVPVPQGKYNFVSLDYVLKGYPEIIYQKCQDVEFFNYDKIPFFQGLANQYPCSGKFAQTFVLTIPHGHYYSHENVIGGEGYIIVDGQYVIRDLLTYTETFATTVGRFFCQGFKDVRKVSGRVLVLSKAWSFIYGHWMNEVLGRLAMAEFLGIDYDWVLIPPTENSKFMLDTLELWGIPKDKIIESKGEFNCIEADELIVPSIPGRRQAISGETFDYVNRLCLYFPNFIIQYLRTKFIAKSLTLCEKTFAKRIFISRKDAPGSRRIVNEDEIFGVLERHGFVRYVLSGLSFVEQVALFNQAEVIMSANGSGLTNIMFCGDDAHIVELFQARSDSTFYNIAQTLGLKYTPVKTCDFNGILGHDWTWISPWIIEQVLLDLNL